MASTRSIIKGLRFASVTLYYGAKQVTWELKRQSGCKINKESRESQKPSNALGEEDPTTPWVFFFSFNSAVWMYVTIIMDSLIIPMN